MDYLDDSGDVVDEIILPNLDDAEIYAPFFVLDDGIAYDAETGDALAYDALGDFESYGDGFIFGIDDMDIEFESENWDAETFDNSWTVDMLGDVNVSIDPISGDTWMQDLSGEWWPVNFDETGNLTTLVDDAGNTFDSQLPNVLTVDGPDGQYMVLVSPGGGVNGDGTINITDPTGGNFTAQMNSPLVSAAVAKTPGGVVASSNGVIDNFFALAANVIQTFAQYKTQQNLQASGAIRNTSGGYANVGGQVVRTNAQGVPIRAASASGMSQNTMILLGVAVVGVILLMRRG